MKMSKAKVPALRPGQKAPISEQYAIVSPKGGQTGTEVTVTKGETVPLTQKSGQVFVLVDKTKHKDGS
jgi:hypothetical protein